MESPQHLSDLNFSYTLIIERVVKDVGHRRLVQFECQLVRAGFLAPAAASPPAATRGSGSRTRGVGMTPAQSAARPGDDADQIVIVLRIKLHR
jgi:hypothetical protein